MVEGRRTLRCAVYTRKSSEEGLEQAFNSLHAQREACEAYIKSQKHEGWTVVPTAYDDGGFSGGSMNRPGLQTLLADVKAGRVHVVVVYKIDRLTRSLFDFAKIVEVLDGAQASFVSVTQSFNSTTSMGRLTLNVLLSFAQFEREVTGERIRDKVAASKKKGMWMGGTVPLGYVVRERGLHIAPKEAVLVRHIFALYAEHGTVRAVKTILDAEGHRTKVRANGAGGKAFSVGHVHTVLTNPLYIGQVRHKGMLYPGTHAPIIDDDLWGTVQARMADNRKVHETRRRMRTEAILTGLIFTPDGQRLCPHYARKGHQRFGYYVTPKASDGTPALRIPVRLLDGLVLHQVIELLSSPQRLHDLMPVGTSVQAIQAALNRAHDLTLEWRTSPHSATPRLRDIVSRATAASDQVSITINPAALMQLLGIPAPDGAAIADPLILEHRIRLHRGKRQVLVLDGPNQPANPNPDLIRAIARAHRWWRMLERGEVRSIADLARRESVPRTWISTQLPLVFLAPEVTQAILDGGQPQGLTLERLLKVVVEIN